MYNETASHFTGKDFTKNFHNQSNVSGGHERTCSHEGQNKIKRNLFSRLTITTTKADGNWLNISKWTSFLRGNPTTVYFPREKELPEVEYQRVFQNKDQLCNLAVYFPNASKSTNLFK